MKKLLLFIILALTIGSFDGFAQKAKPSKAEREKMWREMQEFKMKFLAQEMDLKESQQKKFFELYDQMSEEKRKVFRETKALEKKLKNNPDASDEEYSKVSEAITEAKEKDARIEREYDAKFATFLSSKQIFKMKAAEEKFRDKMRDMHKKKKLRTPRKNK